MIAYRKKNESVSIFSKSRRQTKGQNKAQFNIQILLSKLPTREPKWNLFTAESWLSWMIDRSNKKSV